MRHTSPMGDKPEGVSSPGFPSSTPFHTVDPILAGESSGCRIRKGTVRKQFLSRQDPHASA